MAKAKTLRLILGDQLNAAHSWFKDKSDDALYLIAELKQETDYTMHHVQKVCAFFAAMQHFAKALESAGHRVLHMTLDDTSAYQNLPVLIEAVCQEYDCDRFEYQRPDEYRLLTEMESLQSDLEKNLNIDVCCADTEHFFLPFDELNKYFKPAKHVRMENFYRKMRKRFDVLMEGDEPEGGKWNFDSDNRNAFKSNDLEQIPEPHVFENEITEILARLKKHKVKTIGNHSDYLPWPVTRKQARELLAYFCQHGLPLFGTFQDAMTGKSPHAWSLYHSRLSFAMNAKILSPHEVIDTAVSTYYEAKDTDNQIKLSQIEGFVRQIIGWREYVRGMYWVNMPGFASKNTLSAKRKLPSWFWNGDTNMACQKAAVQQSLEYAYAHHIQRLMVTGNFALIAGIDPDEVDDWYLGIYVDAIEWVELPNTRGMALFADGGWIATKPYAASGNYLNKMSDHCRDCHYKVKETTGEHACPLNALYWNFMGENETQFSQNPRMVFPMKHWKSMDQEKKRDIQNHATNLLANLDSL